MNRTAAAACRREVQKHGSVSSEKSSRSRSTSKVRGSGTKHEARTGPVVSASRARARVAGSSPRSAKGPFFFSLPRQLQGPTSQRHRWPRQPTPAPRQRHVATGPLVSDRKRSSGVDLEFPDPNFRSFAIRSLQSQIGPWNLSKFLKITERPSEFKFKYLYHIKSKFNK